MVYLKERTKERQEAMLRRELLDARKALRSAREGASGPKSKKQRGEWELLWRQNVSCDRIKRFGRGSFLIL